MNSASRLEAIFFATTNRNVAPFPSHLHQALDNGTTVTQKRIMSTDLRLCLF